MSKKISIISLSAFIVTLGFIRDYIFHNINWVYKTLTTNRQLQARKEFHFLMEWNAYEILTLKWTLTILFYLLFFFLTYFTLRLAFKNQSYNRITIGVFISLFLISGLLYSIGYIGGVQAQLYGSILTLMQMAQSFIPLMILGVLYKFIPVSGND